MSKISQLFFPFFFFYSSSLTSSTRENIFHCQLHTSAYRHQRGVDDSWIIDFLSFFSLPHFFQAHHHSVSIWSLSAAGGQRFYLMQLPPRKMLTAMQTLMQWRPLRSVSCSSLVHAGIFTNSLADTCEIVFLLSSWEWIYRLQWVLLWCSAALQRLVSWDKRRFHLISSDYLNCTWQVLHVGQSSPLMPKK